MYYLDKKSTCKVLDYEKHFNYPFKLFGITNDTISIKRFEKADGKIKFKKSIIIPSTSYPLPNPRKRNEIKVFNKFTNKQLDESVNKDIIEAFNSVKFEISKCFANSKKLQELLKSNHKVQLFSGWFFTDLFGEPSSHCWLYVDDCYLLDLSNTTIKNNELLNSIPETYSEEEARNAYKNFYLELLKQSNFERCGKCQMTAKNLYIGVEIESRENFNSFTNELLKMNHSSIIPTNEFNHTRMQEEILKASKE